MENNFVSFLDDPLLEEEEEEDNFVNFLDDTSLDKEENFVSFLDDSLLEEEPAPDAYSEDEIVSNNSLYQVAENFVALRYGDQAIEDATREDVVNKFLNNRRGTSSGNSVSGLAELDFLNEISKDTKKMATTGEAYALYENMSGLYSSETTLSEKASGTLDFLRYAILDPINLVGFGVGRVAAGGAFKVAMTVAKKEALKAMSKEAAKTVATKETIKEAGEKAMAVAVDRIGKDSISQTASNLATRTAMKGQGLKKLAQTSAMKEIGAVTAFDGVVAVGMEFGYQNGLVRTGVQEDVNKYALGIAFIGASVMGGVQAGSVLRRGEVDIALPSLAVKTPEPEDINILKQLSESIVEYSNRGVPKKLQWERKVKAGRNLDELDSEFFIDMLIGIGDADKGETYLKGLSQIAFESGVVFKKNVAKDTYSNWISNLIVKSDPQDIKTFAKAWSKATGTKIKDVNKLSTKDFANIFAAKINNAARVLNAASQGSRMHGIGQGDYNLRRFVDDALDLGLMPKEKAVTRLDKLAEGIPSVVGESVSGIQNRVIRTLVSHPSTSYLNFLGWNVQTALGSAVDVSGAILHGGVGTIKKAFGMLDKGADPLRVSSMVIKANANRIKLMLNPTMTHEAYKSILSLRGAELDGLTDVLPGGIKEASTVLADSSLSINAQLLGIKTDEAIDLIQKLSLVKGQDAFTKSQEFIYQLDKGLRVGFNKSWDEFFTDPNAFKNIASKDYRGIESEALQRTLERISSKSYKDKGTVGEIAGLIEDARNIPFVGLLVPFGRFFNNTVDFAIQQTPLLPHVTKSLGGFYKTKSYSELTARSTFTLGTIYTLAQSESENRKQGLGIDQMFDPMNPGQIINVQYDYPISFYKYAGRYFSYFLDGETPPPEIVERIRKDVGVGSLTRSLGQTGRDVQSILDTILSGEDEAFIRAMQKTFTAVGSQAISGITRPLEPVNFTVGLLAGSDGEVIDRKQGNIFLNKSLRYMDNIVPMLTGGEMAPQSQQAAGGPSFVQTTKMLGKRPVRLTATERVMNIMGIPTYKLNASYSVSQKAPESANIFNEHMFNAIESESQKLLDTGFVKMSSAKQKLIWGEVAQRQKKIAKTLLFINNSGASDTVDLMFEISDKYSWKEIDSALEGISKNMDENLQFEDLTRGQMYSLQTWLETKKTRTLLGN